jgi:hypothetical protein
MKYFAYGSNMSISRLRERAPSALALGCHALKEHDLRFHKSSTDGSGKCDAFYTGDAADIIFGALFEISHSEKPALDRAEGLGYGYEEKSVAVHASDGSSLEATTYIATNIDERLKPYSWYVNHVRVGAGETQLPDDYVQRKISVIESIQDADKGRDAKQRAVHS